MRAGVCVSCSGGSWTFMLPLLFHTLPPLPFPFSFLPSPPSFPLQEDGSILNVQCGYRTLDPLAVKTLTPLSHYCTPLSQLFCFCLKDNYYLGTNPTIYTEGCVGAVKSLFRGNINTLLGVGVGLLIFQLVNIMLAGGQSALGPSHWVAVVLLVVYSPGTVLG